MTTKTEGRTGWHQSPQVIAPRHNSSPVDKLVQRLDGVKRTGPGRYIAKCPAHADRTASLSVRELDSGVILLHCFAGCDVHSVLSAVSLEMNALFPEREIQHGKPERRPFPAADILRCIGFEALVVAAAGVSLLAGEPFSQTDRDRLILAVARIQCSLDAGGLSHEQR